MRVARELDTIKTFNSTLSLCAEPWTPEKKYCHKPSLFEADQFEVIILPSHHRSRSLQAAGPYHEPSTVMFYD